MSSHPSAAASAGPSSSSRSRKSGKAKLETGSYTLGGGPVVKMEAFETTKVPTAVASGSGSRGRRVKGLPARSSGSGTSGGGRAGSSSRKTVKQEIAVKAENDWIAQQPVQFATTADLDLPDERDDDASPPPKAKRAKSSAGKGKAKADEGEKRGSRLRKTCPKAVLERLDRVRTQRFYLIDRERHPDGAFEIMKVLGSTGNVYTVTIALTPSCDCHDGRKNGTCKHIIFCMLKVLQAPEHGDVWFQKSLLTTELAELFANAPPSPQQSALAASSVRASYRQALGKAPEADPFADAKGNGGLPEKKMPEEGDDCPVCYDDLAGDEGHLHFCLVAGGCGRALHKDCAQQWTQTKQAKGEEVTCVWCRSSWASQAAPQPAAGDFEIREGYVNFGRTAGMSDKRDTSSYYHGPRRGERYNWQSVSQRYR